MSRYGDFKIRNNGGGGGGGGKKLRIKEGKMGRSKNRG